MKVSVPDYYKKFKCIHKYCTDTCCAGWEVEVDEGKYGYYKTVTGELGEHLKEVMVPQKDGEGCFFKLKKDKRCPFLNEKNLCDIYTELGEEALCETCTDFPRFKNIYGAVKEIGLAPSCFTAAMLMVNAKNPAFLETYDDGDMNIVPNDIDPAVYMRLRSAREELFAILWEKDSMQRYIPLEQSLLRILDICKGLREEFGEASDEKGSYDKSLKYTGEDILSLYLEVFPGMELINEDWLKAVESNKKLLDTCDCSRGIHEAYKKFDNTVRSGDMAFRQLMFYYIYRFFLESVYDLDPVSALKIGIVAYLCCKRLCVASFAENNNINADRIADIFHLYSRQFEHSGINFSHYTSEYKNNSLYSCGVLEKILLEYM